MNLLIKNKLTDQRLLNNNSNNYAIVNAPPMVYRTAGNDQQATASFPPPVYYRDTFGLQPINSRRFTDSLTSDYSDNESIATKSTVKTTINIFHPLPATNPMYESQYTDLTQSYQVEQILTNQVLITYARPLLILALIKFGCAIQLFIFAVICLFFGGSPYYFCLIASIVFMITFAILIRFIRQKHSRIMLIICCVTISISFIMSIGLFIWTAYLIYDEERRLREDGYDIVKNDMQKTNHIIRSTRLAMYSLHMVLAPIYVCSGAILYIIFVNINLLRDGKVSNGYFFSQPTGNQTVLVPITLKQVRRLDQTSYNPKNISIGIQTSLG